MTKFLPILSLLFRSITFSVAPSNSCSFYIEIFLSVTQRNVDLYFPTWCIGLFTLTRRKREVLLLANIYCAFIVHCWGDGIRSSRWSTQVKWKEWTNLKLICYETCTLKIGLFCIPIPFVQALVWDSIALNQNRIRPRYYTMILNQLPNLFAQLPSDPSVHSEVCHLFQSSNFLLFDFKIFFSASHWNWNTFLVLCHFKKILKRIQKILWAICVVQSNWYWHREKVT